MAASIIKRPFRQNGRDFPWTIFLWTGIKRSSIVSHFMMDPSFEAFAQEQERGEGLPWGPVIMCHRQRQGVGTHARNRPHQLLGAVGMDPGWGGTRVDGQAAFCRQKQPSPPDQATDVRARALWCSIDAWARQVGNIRYRYELARSMSQAITAIITPLQSRKTRSWLKDRS